MNTNNFQKSDSNIFSDEIKIFEERLSKKERSATPEENKDVVKKIVEERMKEGVNFSQSTASRPTTQQQTDDVSPRIPSGKVSVQNLIGLPRKEQLNLLVGIALSESISLAASLASQLDNPYLIDELHDVLVDNFYEELSKRNKF